LSLAATFKTFPAIPEKQAVVPATAEKAQVGDAPVRDDPLTCTSTLPDRMLSRPGAHDSFCDQYE
jgi:hypothetical protein